MDKTPLYIRKIIALIVVFSSVVLTYEFIPWQYTLPPSFFVLSILITRITGEKPAYLFGLQTINKFLNDKGGIWLLLKWLLNLAGLLYDIAVHTLYGVYLVFDILIDILVLLKTVIYWIIHAIIWFLKLFIPPIIFLYSNFIHYCIKWPWWIYQLTYRNTSKSINRNFYHISFRGAFFSIFIALIFFGTGIITGIPSIGIPGLIFSTLPIVWSFGTIAYLRHDHLQEDEISQIQKAKNSGIASIRAIVYYLVIFLILLIAEIILNILGWIPSAGFSFIGISLNMNTLFSLILLFLGVILIFAVIILPSHIVNNNTFNTEVNESILFLGIIGKKFLRYIGSIIPATFFSGFLLIIPVIILYFSLLLTITIRDNVIDTRIGMLKENIVAGSSDKKAEINKNIRLLKFYKSYPQNIIKEFSGIKELSVHYKHLIKNEIKAREDIDQMENEYRWTTDSLKNVATLLRNSDRDDLTKSELTRIQTVLYTKEKTFNVWKTLKNEQIAEMSAEKSLTRTLIIQLPVVSFLTIIWCSFFGGLVLAVLLSYLANIFYELYIFREDGRITHFLHTKRALQKQDNKQPLLGFTLLIAIIAVIFLFLFG